MTEIRGNYFILNGIRLQAEEYEQQYSQPVFYEVIRVIDQKCLFMDDHFERLSLSCRSAGITIDTAAIHQNIEILINSSDFDFGNIKVNVFRTDQQIHIACFYIPHHYPQEEDYELGVKTKSFAFIRPNPTIKRWNEEFRSRINRFIREQNIYEALLLNKKNEFTEGSKSNLFFIDDKNRVITAPESFVLPGITRKYVLQICNENGITVIEDFVEYNRLSELQSCFISGTSPMILPVCQIDNIDLNVQSEILKLLIDKYRALLEDHLA